MSVWIAAAGWLLLAFWLVLSLPSVGTLPWRSLRRRTAGLSPLKSFPRLSVIVPARDEAAAIEQTLVSLLENGYPQLEVIAVDDRSTDGTGEIMDALAGRYSQLRVLHVAELPDGWLGKNHAMHRGATAAEGEWLLFTDGDIFFAPGALARTVGYCVSRQIDHLCLLPAMMTRSYLESALVAAFGLIFTTGTQPWLVPSPWRRAYAGVGAFNMVRRRVYDEVGGHLPLRLEVVDDVKLGKLIKRSGHRSDVLLSDGEIRVRWQSSAWQTIVGLEKNAFAALEYSIVALLRVSFCALAVFTVPYIVMLVWLLGGCGLATALPYVLVIVAAHCSYTAVAVLFEAGWAVCPMLPVAMLGLLLAFWRSAVLTLWRGGVRWRETFYPLSELRSGIYR